MLHCMAHQPARQALHNSMGGRDINITKLLTMPKMLPALFWYIATTGPFCNIFREYQHWVRNNKGAGKEDRGEESETVTEDREEDSCTANTQYLTPGLSTTYYSTTSTSRTTPWPLKADDKEISDRRDDPQCTYHIYLISYIWYTINGFKKNYNKPIAVWVEWGILGSGLKYSYWGTVNSKLVPDDSRGFQKKIKHTRLIFFLTTLMRELTNSHGNNSPNKEIK